MSIVEKIIRNIENNIQEHHGCDDVLRALELITRMPVTFKRMVDAAEQLPKYPPICFKTPDFLSNNMKSFLAEAYFGLINPNDPSSDTLKSVLFSKEGISTRAF